MTANVYLLMLDFANKMNGNSRLLETDTFFMMARSLAFGLTIITYYCWLLYALDIIERNRLLTLLASFQCFQII